MALALVLVLCVLALAIGWRYAAGQKKHRSAQPEKAADALSRHHCVEVRAGTPACEAVRQLEHVRFLPDEAPTLPVSGCTGMRCACRYVHYDDRREDDRRNPYGQWANLPPAIKRERRSRTDRRRSRGSTTRPSIAR
jgi:hypothetical protein